VDPLSKNTGQSPKCSSCGSDLEEGFEIPFLPVLVPAGVWCCLTVHSLLIVLPTINFSNRFSVRLFYPPSPFGPRRNCGWRH
jgi:hypothetical protein